MNFFENTIDALTTIFSNKLRSFLSMLGIVIGIASVIIMIAIGQGAQASVTNRIQQLGSNLLLITPGNSSQTDVRNTGKSNPFVNDDIDAIKSYITSGIAGISAEYSGRKQIVFGAANSNTSIKGVLPDYTIVNNFPVDVGRFINEDDIKNSTSNAVIGSSVVNNLFSGINPVGQELRIEGKIFNIIGVMTSKGQSGFSNADDVVFIPLSTAQKRVFGNINTISTISVSVNSADLMDTIKNKLNYVLMQQRKVTKLEDADFTVLSQADAIKTLSDVTKIFSIFLGGIASISLIVGGIGVMNIMLVSVTERTREIGIRKAIGAHNKDILLQFLNESVILSVISGIIGVLLSYGVISFIASKNIMQASITSSSVILAVVSSTSIGIFFGIFPAYKASKLKPIDALRSE